MKTALKTFLLLPALFVAVDSASAQAMHPAPSADTAQSDAWISPVNVSITTTNVLGIPWAEITNYGSERLIISVVGADGTVAAEYELEGGQTNKLQLPVSNGTFKVAKVGAKFLPGPSAASAQ